MNIIERVRTSKVFSRLSKDDRGVVLNELEKGNGRVIEDTEAILRNEDAVNRLFDRSIAVLSGDIASRMKKWFERQKKLLRIAKKEESQRNQDIAAAEQELDTDDK